jgi:hypothetical protein
MIFIIKVATAGTNKELKSSFLWYLLALVGVLLNFLILLSKALILDIGGFKCLLFLVVDFGAFNSFTNVNLYIYWFPIQEALCGFN